MTAFILHSSRRDGAFSSAFFDIDAAWRTDSSSSALDDVDAGEDVYEMALEVLEGDEAYRLESSGSISPESDVDRLLENADAERFPGDVTLIRVFSIQRDVDGGMIRSGQGKDDAGLDDAGVLMASSTEPDFRRFSNMDDADGPMDERLLQSDIELYIGETESEASLTVARRSMHKAFDSVDLVSVDLHSNSSSTVGLDEDTTGARRTGSEGSGKPDRSFADSGLVCGATFSNVKSKDALIRTSLTVSSFTPPGQRTTSFNHRDRDDRGLRTPESEDISLDMTSSDSLYSTDDCFCDSSFPDTAGGRPAFPAAPLSFNPREPSPEDLFDLALESRSDLGGSSIGSSSFYDAVQCSSTSTSCVHRDPSPEEAFDLALETLSDVIIDDDSSSVFVIAPRPSATVSKRPDLRPDLHRPDLRPDLHRPDLRPDLHRPTIVCHRTAYDVENTRSKMADVLVNSDSFCDLCGRRRCYATGNGGKGFCCGGRSSSSCEGIINGDQLMRGTIGESSSVELPTDWETRCCGRRRPQETHLLPQEETSEELCWSSDPCPSSPETSSTLADYSTDDCAGGESEEEEEEEEEEDSSVTDCDGVDPSSSIRSDFFLRLLRRGRTDPQPVTAGRTREKMMRRMEEDRLLDQIQICSIEDLMTDSDLERDSAWNLKARGLTTTAAGLELPLNDNSPILSLFRNIRGRMDGRANESSDQEVGPDRVDPVVVGPIQPLSPPISQSMRTDVQYARKSKIPKLPGSRTTIPPVRISW